MRKSYLLVYNDNFGTREEAKEVLNKIAEISNWRYDMPYMFYIVSEYSAKQIASKIREHIGKGAFIVTENTDNSYGWLNGESWYLLQNKVHKPK